MISDPTSKSTQHMHDTSVGTQHIRAAPCVLTHHTHTLHMAVVLSVATEGAVLLSQQVDIALRETVNTVKCVM